MKYCDFCLNHGLRILHSRDHFDKCSLRKCVCHKCRDLSHKEGPQEIHKSIASTSSHNQFVWNESAAEDPTQNCSQKDQIINDYSLIDEFSSDPMEEVKRLAQELSNSDISEKELLTCVLHSLLESNNFDINETKRQLNDARNTIAESLIYPSFNVNRELNLKRSRSPPNKPIDSSSNTSCHKNSDSSEKSSKILCSPKRRAKKSFPPIKINGKFEANKCQTKSSIVKTSLKELEKTSEVPNIEEESAPQPLLKTAQQVVKKPVQSVRPLSNTSAAPTTSVSGKTLPIISCESQTLTSSQKSYQRSVNRFISSDNLSKRSNTCPPKVKNSVKDSNENRLKIFQSVGNEFDSEAFDINSDQFVINSVTKSVDNYLPEEEDLVKIGEQLEFDSKIKIIKNTESNDWSVQTIPHKQNTLCAKVLTPEDALIAVSTIPTTKPSIETPFLGESSISVASNGSYSEPQNESNPSLKANEELSQQNIETKVPKPSKRSFEDQFLLFLSTNSNKKCNSPEFTATTSNNMTATPLTSFKAKQNEQKKKSPKEIIEITID